MRFNSNVMHNLCKNEIMESVPIFMATAVYVKEQPVVRNLQELNEMKQVKNYCHFPQPR